MSRFSKFKQWLQQRGPLWTGLYTLRWLLLKPIDAILISIEKKKYLTGSDTVSSHYHTESENRQYWTEWDWTKQGNEWTEDAKHCRGLEPDQWKASLIDNLLKRYAREGSAILEVGPGAGRWSAELLPYAGELILADITPKCLDLCRQRFSQASNIEFCLITGNRLNGVKDSSIDLIWSYDVFVHINPTDTAEYIAEFARIMRSGGIAIIHHAGGEYDQKHVGYRSHMTGEFFARLVKRNGLELVQQSSEFVHREGDIITIFRAR